MGKIKSWNVINFEWDIVEHILLTNQEHSKSSRLKASGNDDFHVLRKHREGGLLITQPYPKILKFSRNG